MRRMESRLRLFHAQASSSTRRPWRRLEVNLLIVLLVLSTFPLQAFGTTVVYPTGDPVVDVAAIRAAVQAGGTVLLKATDVAGNPRPFELGNYPVGAIDWDPYGAGYIALGTRGEIVPVSVSIGASEYIFYVSLGHDVRLLGETRRGYTTTLRGGTIPIRNFEPLPVPGVGDQIVYGVGRIAIEGIRFSESALQSIYTQQLGSWPEVRELVRVRQLHPDITIRGNEFHDVQPAFGFAWYALAAVTDGPAGTAEVAENHIHFASGRWDAAERAYEQANGLDPAFELWEGISIADLHRQGTISRNRVSGVDVGILVYFDGSDFVCISDNDVTLRPEGLVGIAAQANHRYLIEGNTVVAPGRNPDGIYLWATDPALGIQGSVVRHNRVVLDGSDWGGISMFGGGSRNAFVANRVEGSAAYTFGLVADFYSPDSQATENLFAGNQISRFTPRDSAVYGPGVDVFFDTHTRRNLFVGTSGTVLDLGAGNVFVPRVAGGGQP